MQVIRLYADDAGQTRFEDARFDFRLHNFPPPAQPLHATDPAMASRYLLLELPAGWKGPLHPSQQRQLYFGLAGVLEVRASDGKARRIGRGDALFMEDLSGAGHTSHVIGDEMVRAVILQLA